MQRKNQATINFNKNNEVTNEKTAEQFLLLAKKAPKGLKEKLEKLAKVAGKS
jgi:hypothetical protein